MFKTKNCYKRGRSPPCADDPTGKKIIINAFTLTCCHPFSSESGSEVNMNLPSIPIDEILPGATIRLVEIDSVQYLSVRDIIMHVCRKNANNASDTWRTLDYYKKDQVCKELAVFQFPGRGQLCQPVITLAGSIKLVMMLPGKQAQQYKTKFAEIISRYLEGDQKLCQEIEENRSIGKKRSYARFVHEMECMVQEDKNDEMPQVRYIYATRSPAFPGLIKIGRTANIRARLSNLNTACAPAPHSVITMAPTLDMHRDEYLAHSFFAKSRREGEFFQIGEEEVRHYFSSVIIPHFQEELLQLYETMYEANDTPMDAEMIDNA